MSDTQDNAGEAIQEVAEKTPVEQKGTSLTDVEALQAELNKARAVAAAERARRKEKEAQAEKWAEFEDSQKSELEKAIEAQQEAQRIAEQERIEAIRAKTALQFRLDPEDLDLLGTGDEETLKARAERIRKLHEAAVAAPPPTNLPQGNPVPGTEPPAKPAQGPSYPPSWNMF